MKQVTRLLFLLGIITCFSCERETDKLTPAHDIAFYTLEEQSIQTTECYLDEARFKEKDILISSDEILSYHPDGHYFTLAAAAINRLKSIKSKIPFYLKINNKVVYAGFLMPGYLSLSCQNVIVIDPISYSNNNIQVRFNYNHYASTGSHQMSQDLRNHEKLLQVLQEKGKLIR